MESLRSTRSPKVYPKAGPLEIADATADLKKSMSTGCGLAAGRDKWRTPERLQPWITLRTDVSAPRKSAWGRKASRASAIRSSTQRASLPHIFAAQSHPYLDPATCLCRSALIASFPDSSAHACTQVDAYPCSSFLSTETIPYEESHDSLTAGAQVT